MTRARALSEFRRRFAGAPTILVRAPGRVNLIGEHTDYNNGFVLPMAIDRAVWLAARPAPGAEAHVHALELGESARFPLDGPTPTTPAWTKYFVGAARQLSRRMTIRGYEAVLASDLPIGAGLSSSAALTLAAARLEVAICNGEWDARAMALLAQRVEHDEVGVTCGIMDPVVICLAEPGAAQLIDCATLAVESVTIPPSATIVVLDTGTRRALANSEYNTRRAECERAAAACGKRSLREVTTSELDAQRETLDPVATRRARHVITENARTLRAADALRRGDLPALGRLFNASHASLRDDFEVSCIELDHMVECARFERGCYGARMTGAGFGGCAVALVDQAALDGFAERVGAAYARTHRQPSACYVCRPTGGVSLEPI
ncbi:MAG: galactokinase [Planctomycetota bacterium]